MSDRKLLATDFLIAICLVVASSVIGWSVGETHGRAEQKKVDEAECAAHSVVKEVQVPVYPGGWVRYTCVDGGCKGESIPAPAPPAKPAKAKRHDNKDCNVIGFTHTSCDYLNAQPLPVDNGLLAPKEPYKPGDCFRLGDMNLLTKIACPPLGDIDPRGTVCIAGSSDGHAIEVPCHIWPSEPSRVWRVKLEPCASTIYEYKDGVINCVPQP